MMMRGIGSSRPELADVIRTVHIWIQNNRRRYSVVEDDVIELYKDDYFK